MHHLNPETCAINCTAVIEILSPWFILLALHKKPCNSEPSVVAVLTSGSVVQHALFVTRGTFLLRGSTLCHNRVCLVPSLLYTHTFTHMLLMDCSLTLSPPPPKIPPWLTARAQRQVEWPLSCLSFSPHHLSSSPTAPAPYWEREEHKPAKPTSTFHWSAGCMAHHQAALLYL